MAVRKAKKAAKPNPFIAKAQKKPKPNPFIEKAKNGKGKSADEMARLREIKAQKKAQEEAARVAAIPDEIKRLEAELDRAAKEYEKALDEASKAFAKLDRLKDRDSERFRAAHHAWDTAEKRSVNWMGRVLQLSRQVKVKRAQHERVAA